jgi:Fic family protein
MSNYIYDLPDWPRFRWNDGALAQRLAAVRHKQDRLIGRMQALGFPLRKEAELRTLTLEVLKSSEIEGEILDKDQVRSSVARRLGVDIGALTPEDRKVEGVVEMVLDAARNYDKSLTRERLFGWHASLFPTGYSGLRKIKAGAWRDAPMEVVSGPIGHERVHFEGPPADRIEREMSAFLEWFNGGDGTDLLLRACIAHLWFVTIHPFEDGNGRIARAIADMMLARSENSPQRFYSMSAQMRQERDAYYGGLEQTQKGTLDITERLDWFLGCLERSLDEAERTLASVFRKARFWGSHGGASFNGRQSLMLNKLLDGIEGKLTSSKWAKMTKCSQDTALRDIVDLVDRGILAKDPAGGRSTSYTLLQPE